MIVVIWSIHSSVMAGWCYIAFVSGFDDDQYARASLNSNLDGRVSSNGSMDEGVSPDSNLICRASLNSNSDWRAFSVQDAK